MQHLEPFYDHIQDGFTHLITDLEQFYYAIDWDSQYVFLALGIYCFCFLTVLWLDIDTVGWFILVLGMSLFGLERMNEILHQNYHLFSKTNYFDKHGLFVGVLVGIPVLLIIAIGVVRLTVGALLRAVKKK
ncbi:transmembrane protein 18-domain-containing protein [Gorgonomyces haynaldii]|nr:transmembrane protein 18-domain-containing protein [Gorgonomyces haynaldii]